MQQKIGIIYDYIIDTTIKQKRLLPVSILYGDGTRFENDFNTFCAVYNAIKDTIKQNNIKLNP